MKRPTMPRGGALFVLLMVPALLAGPVGASEDEDDHGGVHEFHEIMEELGEHTQRIVQAINHEDWAWVAREARLIADHPRPPAEERAKIKAFTGDRHAEFAKYDKAVHQTAAELAEVAEQEDGREVINAFARLQSSCLDCHASFRDDFRQHFYMKD
ncbi:MULTISPECIES: cytochrome c [unclassified Guyparkeria]|uniref:cytochrome c n=1 Tax=unclassified Guyparkeria TaxID=2626246 RepID=UPI0018D247CD|nr:MULTISPECIES: cytochrome c [unclassified Guyparkeria]